MSLLRPVQGLKSFFGWVVQVYGHFALASALLPLLQAAPVARIVTQSSVRSTLSTALPPSAPFGSISTAKKSPDKSEQATCRWSAGCSVPGDPGQG